MFFLQYDAVGSCAGTCVHVVHSNCACTRRSVNSVRHSTCYHKLWGSGQSEEYLRFKCCLHCLYQERIGNTTQDKNTVATYNITYSFSARRGWTFEWRATVNWDNVTSDNEYSDSTDTTTILEIYLLATRPCQGGRSLRNGREHKIVKADKDSCYKFLSYYSSATVSSFCPTLKKQPTSHQCSCKWVEHTWEWSSKITPLRRTGQ